MFACRRRCDGSAVFHPVKRTSDIAAAREAAYGDLSDSDREVVKVAAAPRDLSY